MWKNIQINDETYFFQLIQNSNDEECTYILCDLKEILIEKCFKSDILLRAKELNKRIEFDEKTIFEAICDSPADSNFEKCLTTGSGQYTLKVKYYISERPFNFSWKLNAASTEKFKKLITNPMLFSIKLLVQQTEELKDIIRKKDIEIEQYKLDGAELRRTTIATEKFDLANFDYRYSKISPITNSFLNMIEKDKDLTNQSKDFTIECPEGPSVKSNSRLVSERHQKLRKSPKNRKRKIQEFRRNMTLSRLKGELKYEDSDSSNPSQSSNIDIQSKMLEITKSLRELEEESNKDFLEKTHGT